MALRLVQEIHIEEMKRPYIQKNLAFIVGALHTAMVTEDNIELSRLSLVMPLLMDDLIVAKLIDQSKEYSLETLVSTNSILLANYNERYLSTLALLYQAVALLLDMQAVSMRNGVLTRKDTIVLSDMNASWDCQSLNDMCKSMIKLLNMTEGKNVTKMYQLLKVEL